MLTFNCTQATCKFFSHKDNGKQVSRVQAAPSPNWRTDSDHQRHSSAQWQLHTVKIKRKSVLLAMHMETRFAMVFVGIKQNDLHDFTRSFVERWLNEMLRVGMQLGFFSEADFPSVFERFVQQHLEFELVQRSDRSVQGHMNQNLAHLEDLAAEMGALPANIHETIGFDEWVNSHLRCIGGSSEYFHPDEEMFQYWRANFGFAQRTTAEQIAKAFQQRRRIP
ncbi:hypothetical protein HBO12_12745 [Pseudomonas sp. WS 5059]|uniref:DUF6933 domain-containing protein n=1 Tax=Pseudomonas sp. WS 5059 TaxID=2717491 RepID=UPI0014731840|nr:hypothetical protein [Pseudomonas sp. WS 5059]NMY03825.1 hypothetical protein [Pseudomonas sp. WS 5059]